MAEFDKHKKSGKHRKKSVVAQILVAALEAQAADGDIVYSLADFENNKKLVKHCIKLIKHEILGRDPDKVLKHIIKKALKLHGKHAGHRSSKENYNEFLQYVAEAADEDSETPLTDDKPPVKT